MKVVIKKVPSTLVKVNAQPAQKVQVYKAGATGKSAYDLWLAAGNVGTLDEFFSSLVNRNTKVYQYVNRTEMVINHQIGKRAMVQCIDEQGNVYVTDVEHITLDTVIIRTNISKNLTIIIQ